MEKSKKKVTSKSDTSIENLTKDDKRLDVFKEASFEPKENPFVELFKEHLPKQIVLIAFIVVFIIFLFLNLNSIGSFFNKLVSILAPIILGWVMAFIMSPLYNILVEKFSNKSDEKFRKFAKHIATIICALVVVGVCVGLIFLFVPQLYNSIISFSGRFNGYLNSMRSAIASVENNADNAIVRQILEQVNKVINDLRDGSNAVDFNQIFASVYNGFYVSLKAILNVFVGFVVMIYSLNMKEEFADGLKRILFAIVRIDYARKILAEVRFAKQVFTGFFVGKFLDSLIIGVLCYICCQIMQMPYTPLIAVIVGVTNIIPFFGPFIGAIPSFILILLEEPFSWRPYGFLVFILVLQQIDGNIIGPKILGDKTGVGSFWVLFSILLFGGLFGFVGMLVAVPLWAIITRLFDEFVTIKLKEKNYPLTSEDYKKLKQYNMSLQEES